MATGRWVLGFAAVCSLGLVVACGSDDEDTKKKINGNGGTGGNTGGNGGTGGSSTGGSGGSTGGSGGSTGGSGGNTGGSGGNTGGAAGNGGAAGSNTGGVAGSNTGGVAGSNTGGVAGSNTGGAAGSSTGGQAGSNTGGAAGSNTGGTGGGTDGGVPNITPKLSTVTFWGNCFPAGPDPLFGEFDAKYDNAGTALGALTITKASIHVVNGSQTMDWTFAVTPVSSGNVSAGGSKTTTHTKTAGSGAGTGGPCAMCNGDSTITVEWTDGSSTQSSSLNGGPFQCVF